MKKTRLYRITWRPDGLPARVVWSRHCSEGAARRELAVMMASERGRWADENDAPRIESTIEAA